MTAGAPTTVHDTALTAAPASSGEFLGHPRGLAYIAFTEAWERFSFYGMQALLVLYMTGHLLQPGVVEGVAGFATFRAGVEGVFGNLSIQALASQIFGLYIALIYFMPVFGGLLGDRVIGRRRAVLAGAVAMAAGHFMMAFEAAFLPALASLIVGSGLLKGNLAAQVGGLYAKDDRRRDGAYAIYVTSINVGAFVAPLICGTLGELYGWHYGFSAAGIGMMIGIAIYIAGARHLPAERIESADEKGPALQPGDGRAIAAVLVLLAITSLFWTAQTQVWNTYSLWLRDFVDRGVFGLSMPVTWFTSLDSLAVLLLAPLVILFWRRQARRATEPHDIDKIAIGCGVFGASCLLLSAGQLFAGEGKVSLIWPFAFHFLCAVGYLYTAPTALAVVSRAAPPAVNSMLVSCYYLGLFAGGIFSGWLGRFYEPLQPMLFWLLHAVVGCSGTLLIVLLRRPLRRAMRMA